MGGNLINYHSGPTHSQTYVQQYHLNSQCEVCHDRHQGLLHDDPMDRFEYFWMKLELFPQDIIKEYGLRNKVDADGKVFCEV